MTKERLEQYAALAEEISVLKSQLYKLRQRGPDVAGDAVQTAAEFPYSLHTIPIKGLDIEAYEAKMKRIENKLARALDRAAEDRGELEDFISTVPDSITRLIMRLRYIDGLPWRRVADRMGYRCESSARSKAERYLNKCS